MPEYTFREEPLSLDNDELGKQTTLTDLAADGRSVIIYHLMFPEDADEPCPMCAMIVDSFNGVAKHLYQHVNFAVVGKFSLPKLLAYAKSRGWDKVRLLSSQGSSFNRDMHMEHPAWFPDVNQMSGVSVFKKDEQGAVRHVYTLSAHFDKQTVRGGDLLTPVWNALDLIPEGRGDWNASNDYR